VPVKVTDVPVFELSEAAGDHTYVTAPEAVICCVPQNKPPFGAESVTVGNALTVNTNSFEVVVIEEFEHVEVHT
jgi:hypothetical protein